ncbi:MAG: hypothetical protein JWP97_3183 [Labilithrix sp.]|nr:hypothetical protein [Labilithrix sp.]
MKNEPDQKTRTAPADPVAKKDALARLRSIEGHMRGVIQMVEDDGYCIDVLQQTKAIHAALSRIETLLLERHLHHCVATAIRSDKPRERERVVGELLDVFRAASGRSR